VPFLYGGVVTEHHWLTDKQFVDAVAVAMITPGPVVITVGLSVTSWQVCLEPVWPHWRHFCLLSVHGHTRTLLQEIRQSSGVLAFVDGITAAIGAIAGSVIVIAKRSIIDIPTAVIALVSIGLLWKFKKLQEPYIIAGAALVGLVIFP
jgi:chromate transporter